VEQREKPMHTSYRARLVVVGEARALPFKNDGIDAADDAEAWDKACAWYESIRPSGYLAARARFNKTDKEIRKDVFLALPIAGRSP
jgi:hypothetical protein